MSFVNICGKTGFFFWNTFLYCSFRSNKSIYFLAVLYSKKKKIRAKTSNLFPADDINAEDCFTQHMLRLHSVPATINQCCGSGMFIPDPNFSIPDPGSASKNFSILTQKNGF
jgi:hypothetical protein